MRVPTAKQYPKKLSYGSETYKVRFVKKLNNVGETDGIEKEIRIRADMSDTETLRTFIHEVLHLLEFEHPIKIKHKTVYKLEVAIFNFLLDNFLL